MMSRGQMNQRPLGTILVPSSGRKPAWPAPMSTERHSHRSPVLSAQPRMQGRKPRVGKADLNMRRNRWEHENQFTFGDRAWQGGTQGICERAREVGE